jgi:hypothetical protein
MIVRDQDRVTGPYYLPLKKKELSDGFGLPASRVRALLSDCRVLSFVVEEVAGAILGWDKAPSKNDPYDLKDKDGYRYEVRCFNKELKFAPSGSIGSGRVFKEAALIEKIKNIDFYFVCDSSTFPQLAYWIIPANLVSDWFLRGEITASASISSKKFSKLIDKYINL